MTHQIILNIHNGCNVQRRWGARGSTDKAICNQTRETRNNRQEILKNQIWQETNRLLCTAVHGQGICYQLLHQMHTQVRFDAQGLRRVQPKCPRFSLALRQCHLCVQWRQQSNLLIQCTCDYAIMYLYVLFQALPYISLIDFSSKALS